MSRFHYYFIKIKQRTEGKTIEEERHDIAAKEHMDSDTKSDVHIPSKHNTAVNIISGKMRPSYPALLIEIKPIIKTGILL